MPRGVPRRNRIDLGTPPRLDSPFSFDAAECSARSAPLLGINAIPFFPNRAPTYSPRSTCSSGRLLLRRRTRTLHREQRGRAVL